MSALMRNHRLWESPTLYAWYLHEDMLSALFDETSRSRVSRFSRNVLGLARGDHVAYTRELERWLASHSVAALGVALATGQHRPGTLVWCEIEYTWSQVAQERQAYHAGAVDIRCSFQGALVVSEEKRVRVHGSFNPARVTCSTANVELRGTRHQYVLGQIAEVRDDEIELRPLAITTRLLMPPDGGRPEWGTHPDWQRIDVAEVEQFADVDFHVHDDALDLMRTVPEAEVKRVLARLIGEPVVPKDWGGEQSDLWTARLKVAGRSYTAALLLKGPAGGAKWKPMTITMLGKNGDQLQRLASAPAEILVVQHCHQIRPEVVSMVESLASDMRNPRHFMVIDGYDTYALLRHARQLDHMHRR
jgi:hypothetical protein